MSRLVEAPATGNLPRGLVEEFSTRLSLKELVRAINTHNIPIPQPEGREVAEAYQQGLLPDESTMLHVIATLLHMSRGKS